VARAEQALGAAEVSDETFDADVLKSTVPVLVDFWAPWCGPCKMIAPMVDEIARDYAGKAKAVKINTDASPDIASQYGVRSIPTVMIFKAGSRVETIIGAVPKSTLTAALDKFL
jgi:thioredoxin 1